MKIEFTIQETDKLKKLIKELNSYYDYDEEFENHTENWNVEDVDAQREIACELAGIIELKLKSK
jgi:hypothetical protein